LGSRDLRLADPLSYSNPGADLRGGRPGWRDQRGQLRPSGVGRREDDAVRAGAAALGRSCLVDPQLHQQGCARIALGAGVHVVPKLVRGERPRTVASDEDWRRRWRRSDECG
jgi:hypothetical protein